MTSDVCRHVNDPMLTEMFNIVGFHLTTKLTQRQKQSISRKHGLCSSALELDPRLYSNSKSASHLAKEERVLSGEARDEDITAEAALTSHDLRVLVR